MVRLAREKLLWLPFPKSAAKEACVLEPSLDHAARVDNVHAVFGEPSGFALSHPEKGYILGSVPQPGRLEVFKKHLLQVMLNGNLPALATLFLKCSIR